MSPSTFVTEPVPGAAPALPTTAVVRGHGLVKRFGTGTSAVDALRGVDIAFDRGSFTAIMGPSGSGKSTLLHILAGLDRSTEGWVEIDGTRLDELNDRDLTLLRRRSVGFVFQAYNLLPVLTAEENITLPLRIGGQRADRDWLETLIEAVGLGDRRTHRPAELSGGQQQRVAVARALVTRPAVVFGDEPTGNLDSTSSREILALMRRAVDEFGQTIVMVTHDPSAATVADRVAFLIDGRVADIAEHPTIDDILDHLRVPEAMIAVALRSMAQRKLRSALTAVAILLGVAMIAGTYVQTDQIRTAMNDITRTANSGVDAQMAPRKAFTSTFGANDLIDQRTVVRASQVPGAADVQGELFQTGSLVVKGRTVEPKFAPAIVVSAMRAPFDPLRNVAGRLPGQRGEVLVNRKLAQDEHLVLGQRVGVTTATGIQRVRLVGIADYGNVASIGGATLIVAPMADVQAWYRLKGKVSRVVASAAVGLSPAELVARLRRVLPRSLEIKTGAQTAADDAKQANDSIGSFLTPALLAFSGAALLVGAFIIFNTFSISVAQRRREFALMRSIGATRRQVLFAVAAEALVLGVSASILGLLCGLGFARGLGALFDAAGWGIPRGAMHLAARTIIVGLTVGIGVTLVAALVPAVRATRVPPVAAMREETLTDAPTTTRRRQVLTALVCLAGLALLLQGLVGGGPASSRITAMGLGSLLVFVGVALSARYVVRPLAAVVGWPLQRLGHAMGELARDNATRNPARTAVTAAALMVGLALVVFVSVFAAGLKDSIDGAIADRAKAQLVVSSDTMAPLSRAAGPLVDRVPSVVATAPQYLDQVQVNGHDVSAVTDQLTGIDPLTLRDAYRFHWLHGSDADLQRLVGTAAVVEEQFAKAHGIRVGERFRVTGPTGHRATLTAIAEYRDPQLMQGVMVDVAQFRALSSLRDPLSYFVTLAAGTDVASAQAQVKAALARFPSAKVRTSAQYSDHIGAQLDQIVYLLYALLAMSIVISMFGIANSLFLSIHERTRELGMLRAIGATAAQVRRMIRYESVITSLIGGVLGTGVGILFAWLTTFAVKDLGVGFSIPVGQLVVFLLLAVVVGVLGAVAPARRAARLQILDAVRSE